MATLTRGAIAAGVLVGGIAVAEVVCRLLGRRRTFRRVRISMRLLLYVSALYAAVYAAGPVLGAVAEPDHLFRQSVLAVGVLLAVIVSVRLIEALVVHGWLGARAETALPTLARQIVFLAVVVVSTLIILDVYLGTPPSALLASSVVISAVVGLSLQQTLGSVAAGVALQSEATFRRGDWVGIGDLEGEVVRMSWRTLHLRTRENDVIIIPNDHAARHLIVNYSRPSRVHATIVEVGTHYRHSPDLVRRVLREATLAAEGVLDRPEPHIWTTAFDDFAVRFKVKFYLDDYQALPDIQAAVMSNIWYHFRRHNIQIPFPIRTVTVTPMTATTLAREEVERVADLRRTLRGASLLEPLSDDEIETLAPRVRTPTFATGETLFHQGAAGDSCYLIREGRVSVRMRDEHGHDIHLAELGPGAILGETSLLTGEPRSASVVALTETATIRIGHEEFGRVIQANPRIAEALAAIIQERVASTAEARKAVEEADRAAAPTDLQRRRIVHRILNFFGIHRRPGSTVGQQ